MENATPRKTSAPYGQACQSCVKAKCRCIREGSTCERCTRLREKCIPSTSIRKKSAKSVIVSRKSRLEDKLDDIVSLLRTQNPVPTASSPTSPALLTPYSDNSSKDTPNQSGSNVLTDRDLAEFHDQHLSFFPFMNLPRTTTAEQLQLEKPILSLAIHTICTKALSKQRPLAKLIKETLAFKLMVDNERSLDLLLALLLVITWSTYVTQGRPFLATMSGLARSLASDLRLDKPHNPGGCPSAAPFTEKKEARTNEENRALLTVFALNASTSTTFKVDFMHWSSQIDEACDKLAKDQECDGDRIIVTIVRISRIIVQAAEVFRRASDDQQFAKHVVAHIGPLATALDTLKSTLMPEHLQQRGPSMPTSCLIAHKKIPDVIMAYLFGAEIAIHELALLQPANTDSTYAHSLDYKRLDSLSVCLQISKACIDHFLGTQVSKLIGPVMLAFTYCLKIIYKLSTLQDPVWDTRLVRATVDLVHTIQECAKAAEQGNEELKQQTGEDSVLIAAAETMRSTASHWKVPEESIEPTAAGLMPTWNTGEVADMTFMDFSDDFWLQGSFRC